MANNKKAQILAAVMCASSVLGGYTVVSAESINADYNDNKVTVSTTTDEEIFTIGKGVNIGSSSDKDGNKYTTIGGVKLYDKGLIIADDDIRASKYSVKTIGYNTQKIQYSPSQGTLINSSLSAIDIKNANNTFNVDKNGKLEAAIVTSKGDVTSNDGKYSLNNIGKQTAGITRDKYGTTTTIENTVKVHASGVSHNVGTIDIYGDMIQATDPNGQRTVIEGNGITTNTVTTDTIKIGDKTIDDDFFGNIGDINTNTAGIERNATTGTTIIEGTTSISENGIQTNLVNGVSITKVPEISALSNGTVDQQGDIKLDDINVSAIDRNTQAITYNGDSETTSFEGNISATGDVTSGKGYSLDAIGNNTQKIQYSPSQGTLINSSLSAIDIKNANNTFNVDKNGKLEAAIVTSKGDVTSNDGKYSLNNIGKQTAGITRDKYGTTTTIENTVKVHASGVSHNVGTIDIYGDMIQATDPNGQRTVIEGNGITTNTVTTDTIKIGDKTIDDDFFGNIGDINTNTAGIERNGETTTIEKNTSIDESGIKTVGDVISNNGKYSLNNIGEKTEKINVTTNSKNRTTFEFDGKIVASESIEAKHGFITQNGNITTQKGDVTAGEYSLKNIGANTQDFNHVANGITEIKGSLISENGGFYTGTPDAGVAITSEGITVSGEGDVKAGKYSLNDIGVKTAGITREGEVTTIEGNTSISKDGINTKAVNGVSITKVPEISALSNGDDDQPGDIKLDDINVSAIDRNTTAMTYSNGTTSFEGNISATGDVTSTSEDGKTTYSLNKVGEKTSAIDYSQINGESTTSIRGHLVVTDIKNANDTFNVNNNGDLKANTVTSDGDVTSKDGETTYSLNTVGEKVDGLYGTDGDITTLKQKTQAMSYNEDSKTTNFDGNINATGDVTSGNGYSLNKVGEKTSAIDYSQINGESTTSIRGHLVVTDIKNANNTFNVNNNGDLKANTITSDGDVTSTSEDGETTYSLNTIGSNTAGIERDGETTTIEGNTSINKDGIKVGNNVEINANGSMTARNGDAYFNFDKDNVSLSNGNNTLSVGNESITIDSAGTKMVLNHEGLDYADGAFYVRNDGTVTANGSMTADDFITKDGVKLSEINSNIETATGTIKGIKRDDPNADYGKGTTSIEGVASFNKDGMTVNTGNSFVNVGTDNIVLNNSGNGIVIDKDGTSIIGAQGKHSINITTTGTEFLNGQDGTTTVISGGTITTDSIKIGDNIIDNSFFGTIGQTNANTAGIERDGNDNVGYTTSIETTFRVHSPGVSHNVGTIDIYGDMIQATNANGQKTIITGNSITTNELTVGGIKFGDLVNRVEDLEEKTQNITSSNPGTGEGGSVVPPTTDGQTGINGDVTVGGDLSVGGNLKADSANIGGVTMKDNTVTATTGNFDNIAVGGEGGTTIDKDGITVGTVGEGESHTSITKDDVKVTDSQGNTTSLTDVGNRVTGLESSMNSMNNRINDVEDRIDKVGAMAAAIANLRTMGFDPEAPTEIAIGVGQYKSETGLALGVFHYPNQDFMLSASISTSGDEVMGGIGATWKLGRKSAAEKAKDEEAKRLEKAEDMKKLAQEEKVKAQAERHAKLLAEREAQETA